MSCAPTSTVVPDGSGNAPFVIKKGRRFEMVITFLRKGIAVDLDAPARTGRSHLRRLASDIGTPLAVLTVTKQNQVTGRGKADVVLGATATQTGAAPDIGTGRYVLDVEFENDADPDDVIASDLIHVEVTGEATH